MARRWIEVDLDHSLFFPGVKMRRRVYQGCSVPFPFVPLVVAVLYQDVAARCSKCARCPLRGEQFSCGTSSLMFYLSINGDYALLLQMVVMALLVVII